MQLSEIDLSDEQQNLMEICFDMKKITSVASPEYKEDAHKLSEKQEQNQINYNKLFELRQKALPLYFQEYRMLGVVIPELIPCKQPFQDVYSIF
jgi:hypothetical protein